MTTTSTQIKAVDAYWRAANYLAAGMIHLRNMPRSVDELSMENVKRRILGHWGSSPGQAFIWAHANNLLKKNPERQMVFLSGPGHGAPGMIGPVWLDGDYTRVYPEVTRDIWGQGILFRRFSAPGGIGSHCTPETPGSIHEGGELGYCLSHAAGAVLDKPGLIALACIGDGEAETGPIATAWNVNKFLRPGQDGSVLPILHLNGYKIANPTIFAAMTEQQLEKFFEGLGWFPIFVTHTGDNEATHWSMAYAMELALICIDQGKFPVIVMRTPKGWTGPAYVGGKKVEGSWRSHQVPLPKANTDPEQFAQLVEWLKSYKPEELFNENGEPTELVLSNVPETRIGGPAFDVHNVNPLKGLVVGDLEVKDRKYENTKALGLLCERLYRRNDNFRVFGPDETASNRLQDVYKATQKVWKDDFIALPKHEAELSSEGRVIEMLSEHTLVGMMEGYLLTGGHGLFHTYEAFGHVVSSMAIQHSKWLAATKEHAPWRGNIGSWNCLLSSTVWRQDHNGGTHQQPGFIDIAANMNPDTVRVYLPADANTLLAVAEKAFAEPNVLNFIVSDKQAHQQFFTLQEARALVQKGAGIVKEFSDPNPQVIFAASGDVTMQEAVKAIKILKTSMPHVQVRLVNVVNLFALGVGHPHSLSTDDFRALFPAGTPVIFNFHGYAGLIKRLLFDRGPTAYYDWSLHGFQEKGSINTPLELTIINGTDRYTLAIDACEKCCLSVRVADLLKKERKDALAYAYENGVDKPEL